MKVLISGGTGLLGQGLLRLLRETGEHEVRCLVRRTSPVERLGGLELAYGDAGDDGSIARALRGMDAFVHVAGIRYTPEVLEAMRRARVERLVIVSSTSTHSRFEFRSAPRLVNEALLAGSELRWTVVRPSMIYGSELDNRNADKRDLIRHILEQERFDPAGAVMIGDRKHDAIGAKANGLASIGVTWGYGSRQELLDAGVDCLVDTPQDLAEPILTRTATMPRRVSVP